MRIWFRVRKVRVSKPGWGEAPEAQVMSKLRASYRVRPRPRPKG